MKTSRTFCRLILPLLFAILLTAGILVTVLSSIPANDDIAKDNFASIQCLKRENLTAMRLERKWNGFFLFLTSFADPDNTVFALLHMIQLTLDRYVFQKGDRQSSLPGGDSYYMTVPGHSAEELILTVMIPSFFVTNSSHAVEKANVDKGHKEKALIVHLMENGSIEYEGNGRTYQSRHHGVHADGSAGCQAECKGRRIR